MANTVTSANGVTTTSVFDQSGRKLRDVVTDPDDATESVTTSYAYDAHGQVTSVTREDGSVVRYAYDAVGNVVSERYFASATAATPEIAITYTYTDGGGRMESAVQVTGSGETQQSVTTEYSYDEYGRVTQQRQETEAEAGALTVNYRYNGAGQVTSVSYAKESAQGAVDPGNTELHILWYTYDEAGRLSAIYLDEGTANTTSPTNNKKLIRSYAYNAYGEIEKITDNTSFLTGGTLTTELAYTYNDFGLPVKLTYTDVDGETRTVREETNLTYDGNGNILTEAVTEAYSGSTTKTRTYQYDLGNRLISAAYDGTTTTYTYDAVGNRLTRQEGTETAETYTYNYLNQLTRVQQGTNHVYYEYDSLNQLVREDNSILNKSITYTYDDRGNILNKVEYAYVANGGTLGTATDTITYGYEAEHQAWADQLTSYDGEAIRYDASGNPSTYRGYTMTWQARRLTGATGNGNTLSYSYDENGLRTQKTVNGTATQYRYHGSVLISQVTGSNKLLFSYDANGNAVAVNYNGTYYYYVHNGQNDVIRLIDGSNNTVVEYTYDSWGRLLSCTGSFASTLGTQNPFRYRGYVYDTETGLYYLQTRYYDPETARFINADIYVSTGQGVLGNNMYLYCGNNPVVRADDEGDFWNIVVGAVVGAALGALVQIGSNLLAGEHWLDGVGTAALTGAASGALAASGVGLVASVAGNAAISMAGNATNQVIKNKGFDNFDVGDMLIDGAIGAIAGRAGGAGMGRSVNLGTLNKNLTKKIMGATNETIKKGIKYYVSQTKFAYKEYLLKPLKKSARVGFGAQAAWTLWEMLK